MVSKTHRSFLAAALRPSLSFAGVPPLPDRAAARAPSVSCWLPLSVNAHLTQGIGTSETGTPFEIKKLPGRKSGPCMKTFACSNATLRCGVELARPAFYVGVHHPRGHIITVQYCQDDDCLINLSASKQAGGDERGGQGELSGLDRPQVPNSMRGNVVSARKA